MTMPTNVLHLLLVRLKLASNILKTEKIRIFQNLEKLDFVLGGGIKSLHKERPAFCVLQKFLRNEAAVP